MRCKCGFKDGRDPKIALKNNIKYMQCPECKVYYITEGLIMLEEAMEDYDNTRER